MKQYCRYCVHCMTGNGNWCEVKEKEYSDEYFKRINHCPHYEFTPIDTFTGNVYRPRKKKPKQAIKKTMEQISMEEI